MKNLLYLSFLCFSLLPTSFSYAQTSVDFSADITEGCNALAAVQFTDLSSGNITSWHWDFGNNNTSTLKNPTASFTSPGLYTVSLTISGPNGSLTETKNSFIVVHRNPQANFSIPSSVDCQPFTVFFNDNSTVGDAPIAEYIWDFGDGSPENNLQNPTYTYHATGNYNVSLQVVDSNGCKDVKLYSSISVVDRPRPSFSSSNSAKYCAVPYTVNFVNHTPSATGLKYYWDFGDGNTSTAKNPSHTYTSFGDYDVTLIAENQYCIDTVKLISFVSIHPISASFNVKEEYCYGDTVFFNATTTGAANAKWEFGDGTSSTDWEPFKIYTDSGSFEIKLTVNSGANCTATYKDTLHIKKVIADFKVAHDTFCMVPTNLNFINFSQNGNKYTWYRDTFPQRTDQSIKSFQYTFNGFDSDKFYLLAEDSILGCESLDSQFIFLYDPKPIITPLSDIDGCSPVSSSFEFNYSNRFDSLSSFMWYYGQPIDSSIAEIFNHTYTNIGTHTIRLKITNERGCIATSSYNVRVGEPRPVPDFDLEDTICSGSNLYFLAPNVLNDSFIYRAKFTNPGNSSIFYTYRDTSQQIFYHTVDTGALYIQNTFNFNGCESLGQIDTVHIQGPFVNFSTFSQCNSSMIFDFVGDIYGDYSSFEWDFGDGSPTNSTDLNPTHSFPAGLSFEVQLIAYNPDSTCVDTFKQFVSNVPPPEVILNGNTKNCLGETTYIYASGVTDTDTLRWFLNDSLISLTGDSLELSSTTVQTFKVELKVTTQFNCKSSSIAFVTFSKPQADYEFSYTDGCIPFDVKFENTSTSNLYFVDSLFWNIKPWGFDTSTPFSGPITKTVENSMTISANLIIKDVEGCMDTIYKDSLLTVRKNDLFAWVSDQDICVGDSIYFENFSTIKDPNYLWTFGDGDSILAFDPKHAYDSAGVYSFSMQFISDTVCDQVFRMEKHISVQEKPLADFVADTTFANCYPLPVTFTDLSTGSILNKWSWDFGDGSNSLFKNPFHNFISPGKFDVRLRVETTNGCADTIIKQQYIQTSGPTAEIVIEPDSGCIYQEYEFRMINPDKVARFQWDFGDGTGSSRSPTRHIFKNPGKHYPNLILSDSSGQCIKPVVDSLYIFDVQAIFELSDTQTCTNSKIQFSNFSVGALQLFWDFGDGSNSTLNNPVHSYTNAGTYISTLIVTGANGCMDTMQKHIQVNPLPEIETLSDTLLCFGDSIQLWASGGVNYSWSPENFIDKPTSANPIAFPDTTTTFIVRITNQFACVDSSSFTVMVVDTPSANFFRDTLLIIGEYLQLNSNNPNHNLIWQPEVWLNCYDCANPIAQPMKTTMYTLSTRDAFGCFTRFDSILVEVKEAYSVNVPNAFTPNGDGNNEVVYVKGWGIKDLLEFKIYNRWGEMVFETSDIKKGWDGFYKNKAQDVETYVYTVKALMYNNEIYTKKGNINLIR